MKLGIDLDEILADFLTALIKYHNTTYKTSLVREQFKSYRFWETWGGTREDAIQKVYDFHKTTYFKRMKPIPDSQKVVHILKQNNNLVVITSRQDTISKATEEWVNQYFPNIFSNIYFTNHYSQNGDSRTKKQICDSIGINLLIEDSPEYALECLSHNRKVLLLNCPWNKDFRLPRGIYRVNSWKEILKFYLNEFEDNN